MKIIRSFLDYALFAFSIFIIVLLSTVLFIYGYFSNKKKRALKTHRLLSIITGHSYNSIKTYGHEQIIIQQNSSGFFEHVYTLYPLLGANPIDQEKSFSGSFREHELLPGFTFIESKMSFVSLLSRFPRTNFIWSQLWMLLRMHQLIIKENITIIRAYDPFFTGLYALLLAKTAQIPFVIRVGSNYDLLYQKGDISFKKIFKWYFIEKFVARRVFPRTDLVMAANRNYLDYAIENGAKPDRSIVTPFGNLIDALHTQEPSQRPKLEDNLSFLGKPFGLYVGRLTEVKRAEDLLLVVREAKKDINDATIVCVGDGDLADEFKAKAIQLGIENNIFFLGKRKQEWIASLLPMASVYLAPHSGRALVEAAYAGLPLLAYDWEWHSEMVISGVTGELVPYGDWKKMAEVFVNLLHNKKYASELGRNARKMAMEMMDQKTIQDLEKRRIQEVLDLYFTKK